MVGGGGNPCSPLTSTTGATPPPLNQQTLEEKRPKFVQILHFADFWVKYRSDHYGAKVKNDHRLVAYHMV